MKRIWLIISVLCLLIEQGQAKAAEKLPSSLFFDTDTYVNSVGMRFVRIKPGSFLMGQKTDGTWDDLTHQVDWDESHVHKVNITRLFYMSATEITNAQYEQFDPSHRELRGRLGFSQADDEAVVFVSWYNAAKFCAWLSKKEGKSYRLPTEAEWEYTCRAGTTTAFYTGESLPKFYHKNQKQDKKPVLVSLHVGRTPANAWGLYDMHGNIEEWCYDWYSRYEQDEQTDPVGRIIGDFKITRGGSHGTFVNYLRSANRMGTLPEDKSWLIGFRVVLGEMPTTKPLPEPEKPLWARNVKQESYDWLNGSGSDLNSPYFEEPYKYVKIPPCSNGPMFSWHNHQPAITACPNGDLLAIWYSTRNEDGRELGVVAARLRAGSNQWDSAEPFWDVPDRNDHGSAIWWDGQKTIYHFNGLSADGMSSKLALIMRTSTDNGATWSKAQFINPQHGLRNQVIAGVLQASNGNIIVPCDATSEGHGGTALHISSDWGQKWEDPCLDSSKPDFAQGRTGAWIAGIHAGIVQLKNDSLMALGRGNTIEGRMPMSLSKNMGKTWTYNASEFPPIGGGQRLVLKRLNEGPLLLVSFTDYRFKNRRGKEMKGITVCDTAGKKHQVYGMYAALSFDEGKTWPLRRLITDDGPGRLLETTDAHYFFYNDKNRDRIFIMDTTHAEPMGYLAATQTPDGIIHLVSSAQHYQFNLAWLKQPMPTERK